MVCTYDYKLKHVLLFSIAFLALATEEPFNPLNISITGWSDSVVMQVGIHVVKLWKKTFVLLLRYCSIKILVCAAMHFLVMCPCCCGFLVTSL